MRFSFIGIVAVLTSVFLCGNVLCAPISQDSLLPRAKRPCPAPGCSRTFTVEGRMHIHMQNMHPGHPLIDQEKAEAIRKQDRESNLRWYYKSRAKQSKPEDTLDLDAESSKSTSKASGMNTAAPQTDSRSKKQKDLVSTDPPLGAKRLKTSTPRTPDATSAANQPVNPIPLQWTDPVTPLSSMYTPGGDARGSSSSKNPASIPQRHGNTPAHSPPAHRIHPPAPAPAPAPANHQAPPHTNGYHNPGTHQGPFLMRQAANLAQPFPPTEAASHPAAYDQNRVVAYPSPDTHGYYYDHRNPSSSFHQPVLPDSYYSTLHSTEVPLSSSSSLRGAVDLNGVIYSGQQK